MPTWIMKLLRDWLFNKGSSYAANEIKEEDPALIPALKKYREGGSFIDVVKAYVVATPNIEDDKVPQSIEQFRAMLETMPFNEVLPLLTGSLGSLHIPDGDGDPTNDITVAEALSRIVDKVVAD